jgi:hypothetical protein
LYIDDEKLDIMASRVGLWRGPAKKAGKTWNPTCRTHRVAKRKSFFTEGIQAANGQIAIPASTLPNRKTAGKI